jgi:hypothetical protein
VAQCSVQTGRLFWKKLCSGVAVAHCGNCHRLVCRDHFLPQSEGPFLCPACAPRENEDADLTGALFNFRFGSAAVAVGAAGAAAGRDEESGEPGAGDPGASDPGSNGSGDGDSGSSGD